MQGPFYNGYPQGQPTQMQTVQAQPTQDPRAVLIPAGQVTAAWVNSQNMAHDMYLNPNNIGFMVTDDGENIYVKRADQFGRQSPMEIYKRVAPPQEKPNFDMSGYVTTDKFNDFITRFDSLEDKINGLFESLSAPKRGRRREEQNDDE